MILHHFFSQPTLLAKDITLCLLNDTEQTFIIVDYELQDGVTYVKEIKNEAGKPFGKWDLYRSTP